MLAHVQGLKCWKRLTSLGTNRARFTRLGKLDVNVEMLQPFELWANVPKYLKVEKDSFLAIVHELHHSFLTLTIAKKSL